MLSLSRWLRPAAVFISSGLLLAGFSARGAEPAPEPTPTPVATPPATPKSTSFDAVTARLDRGGSFYLYLSAAEWLEHLSKTISDWRDLAAPPVDEAKTPADPSAEAQRQKTSAAFDFAISLVKKSGLEEITGLGASSVAVEPGVYRNTVFVHHEKGKETGFLETLLGRAPHPLTALDLLPPDTAAAGSGDRDLTALVNAIGQAIQKSGQPDLQQAIAVGLQRFSSATGMSLDEFLSSLGGSFTLILTLDPNRPTELQMPAGQKFTIPAARLALLIAVKDDRIYQRVEQTLGMLPGIEKVDEPELRMLTTAVPAVPQLNIRATVARWDKYLILASDDQLVRDIIAAQKSGQGFKASPAFGKLSAGLPTEGNGFSLMTRTFTDALRQVQTTMYDNQPGFGSAQKEMMRRLWAFQAVGPTYGVTAHVEDGWLTVSNAPQSVNKMMAPLLIVPIAIGAGLAMPAIIRAQQAHPPQVDAVPKPSTTETASRSLAQAKQIYQACQLYAGENNGNFPASLHALVPNYVHDDTLFVSPFAPQYPLGFTYTPGLTTSSPVTTILLEDKFSATDHKRVVVHVDGSGEITPLPAQ